MGIAVILMPVVSINSNPFDFIGIHVYFHHALMDSHFLNYFYKRAVLQHLCNGYLYTYTFYFFHLLNMELLQNLHTTEFSFLFISVISDVH